MFHKKHFYRVAAYVNIVDAHGMYALPVVMDGKEYLSRGLCDDYIKRNNLDIDWPGYEVPATTGVCIPECFCKVYRRQIWRALRRFRLSRALILVFAGFERMRRSVAEDRLKYTEFAVVSRLDIPEGYHFTAIKEFFKTLV